METDAFTSYRRIARKTFVLPNGAEAEFEIKKEPRCVSVLVLTTRETVLLVQQFRPGPEAILLELPGGGSAQAKIRLRPLRGSCWRRRATVVRWSCRDRAGTVVFDEAHISFCSPLLRENTGTHS